MKHRELTGLVASSAALLLTLGFACVDADIPNVSNNLRDAIAETYGNAGAPPLSAGGDGGSASTPAAGAGGDGGAAGDGGEPPDETGGAAGSSMAGGAGSDGGGAAGAPPVVGGGCNGFPILQENCATAGCHGEPGGVYGDFASSEEAAVAYIGEEGRLCAGSGSIIDTDDPAASVLLLKLTDEPPCGQQMPLGRDPLSADDVACLEEWISGL